MSVTRLTITLRYLSPQWIEYRQGDVMTGNYRSRRDEICRLRAELRGKGATWRHIAQVVAARWKVNARAAFRYAHGLTQQQVADRWNELWPSEQPMTAKQVSYWEAWPSPTGRGPSPDALNKLARIYQCRAADLLDGEDHSALDPATIRPAPVGTFSDRVAQRGHAEPADVVSRVDQFIAASGSLLATREQDYQRLVSELVEWACRMKRRDILQWISWAAASAAGAPVLDGLDDDEKLRTATALADPKRVDDKVIDHIEAVLWRCIRQDDSLGPQAVLDTALAQRRMTRTLLDEAPAAVRNRLLSVYAHLSQFAGWLSYDLGNFSAAADYYEAGRRAAHEAHNTALSALILCTMSHLATWCGQPRTGVDHAIAAQMWADQTDDLRLRAYARDCTARAFAADGNESATLVAIEQARSYLDNRTERPTIAHFFSSGQLASAESECILRLGRPKEAEVIAERALSAIDDSFVRNRAMVSLRIGVSRLKRPKPDVVGAAEAVSTAAQFASRNRSVRLARKLQTSWTVLSRWDDVPEVKQTQDQLIACRVFQPAT